MQLTILSFFTFFLLLVGALSAPVELSRRSPDLAISLRETGINTKNWHFALVIHSTSAVFTGKQVPVHEYVLDGGCLVYDDSRRAATTAKQLVQSANLIPKPNEGTDEDLKKAVVNLLRTDVKSADPREDPNYTNCFDYAIQAVHGLETHGYVSPEGYAKFKGYYDHPVGGKPYHQLVRDKTYPPLKESLGGSSSHQSTSKPKSKSL